MPLNYSSLYRFHVYSFCWMIIGSLFETDVFLWIHQNKCNVILQTSGIIFVDDRDLWLYFVIDSSHGKRHQKTRCGFYHFILSQNTLNNIFPESLHQYNILQYHYNILKKKIIMYITRTVNVSSLCQYLNLLETLKLISFEACLGVSW